MTNRMGNMKINRVIDDFLIINGSRYSLISSNLPSIFTFDFLFFSRSSFEKIDKTFSSLDFWGLFSLFKEIFLKNEIADNAIPPINMKILSKIISPV